MTIEFIEKDGKLTYLTQFKNTMSRVLFTGLMSKSSKIRRVEEKSSKHQLKIAVNAKIAGKFEASHATINFASYEDMVSFEQEFDKAIKKLQ
jgi:predicted transcriptional regulator